MVSETESSIRESSMVVGERDNAFNSAKLLRCRWGKVKGQSNSGSV